ncbi:MAG: GNAT family N-acetyltransferase [Methanobacteriota archaeon]
MKIRRATLKDVDEMAEMAYEFEGYLIKLDDTLMETPPPKAAFKKVLRQGLGDEKHYIVVAEEKGNLVGMADFWAYPEFLHGGLSGYLNNLYVREAQRGKGLGTKLLENLMEEAKRRGVVAMHIPVKPKNLRALEFYRKAGMDEELLMMERRLDRAER